jgi:hypothetical protein
MRKCLSGNGLHLGNRRFLPLSGVTWVENETGFRFFERAKARRDCVWSISAGRVGWPEPAWKSNHGQGFGRGRAGGGAAAGADEHETPSGGSRAARQDAAPRGGWWRWAGAGGRDRDELGSLAERSGANLPDPIRGGGPRTVQAIPFGNACLWEARVVARPWFHISLAYVKAQPGGGEWRAGRVLVRALTGTRTCVCAAPAGARGGQLPGRRAGESLEMPQHGAGPEGGGNQMGGRAGTGWARRRDGGRSRPQLRRGHPAL